MKAEQSEFKLINPYLTMDRKTIFKLRTVMLIALTVLLTGLAFGVPIHFILGGSAGINLAAAGAAASSSSGMDTKNTGTKSPSLLRPAIFNKIIELRPAKFPMDTMLREIGQDEKIGSWEHKWYAADIRGFQDTVVTGFTTGASGVRTLTVTNIHIWAVDDMAFFPDVNGNDGAGLVAAVVAINPATSTLSLYGMNVSSETLPTIADTSRVIRMGNAKNELDAQTTPYSVFPYDESNYAQIHMAQIEESLYSQLHEEKEVKFGIADQKNAALYSWRMDNEFTALFGVKKKFIDPVTGKLKYTSAGIIRYGLPVLQYTKSSGINDSTIQDWCQQIFDDNNGSDERIVFASSYLLKQLSKVSTIQKQLEAKSTNVIWGITFNRIETVFGVLNIRRHPILNYAGNYAYNGIVLDAANIGRSTFEVMNTQELELDKTGQRRAKAYRLSESWLLRVVNKNTHAIIKGV